MPDIPQTAASVAKRRLAALSEQLVAPTPDQGTFEGIPKLKKIAGNSDAKRLKGKVAIITGKLCSSEGVLIVTSDTISRNQFADGNW